MSRYIKSFSNASDMRAYLDTAAGMKYYLLKNESGTAGVGDIPESGKSIVSLFKGRDYLTFTAQQTNSAVRYKGLTGTTAEYSLDGGVTWADAVGVTVSLANVGDSVKYRGTTRGANSSDKTFTLTGKIAASGSIMSMYNNNPNDTVISNNYAFTYYFNNQTALTQAPELPATTLSVDCYQSMFQGCTGLTQAPELPATTLAINCYTTMFSGCTALTQAPELPATTLAMRCYKGMFKGCTGLTQAPELPATTVEDYAYQEMFKNCSSLLTGPEIFLSSSGYMTMDSMFNGSGINYVKIHATSWSTANNGWMYNVGATGTVECPSSLSIPSDTYSGIPSGWTKVTF